MDEHRKRLLTVRYRLLGRADVDPSWYLAVEALEFARGFHGAPGKTRKDKRTPEFDHQVSMAQFGFTLTDLVHPVDTVAVLFLHDVMEDYDVGYEEIERRFGPRVARSTWLVTKKHRGIEKDEEDAMREIAADAIASIVKGIDNDHNVGSMTMPTPDGTPVFGPEKQRRYLERTKALIVPMLKAARRAHPRQEKSYEIIKRSITTKCAAIEASLAAMGV